MNLPRPRIPITACLLLVAFASSARADKYPYEAAAQNGATLFSGPGKEFYATQKLSPGEIVEVYHEDKDGWCAIRPVESSYSWVAGKRFTLLEDGAVAECQADGVPSFVGSDLAASRDAIAVRLKRGERVAVLGTEKAGGQIWLKISPPSGEFRFVERRSLKPVPATSRVAKPTPAPTKPKANPTESVAAPSAKSPAKDVAAPATEPIAKPSAKPTEVATAPVVKNAKSEFWRNAVALDLELTSMAAREPSKWRFDDLRRDAQNLYDGAASDDEYDAARHLLGKLAQFESTRRERVDLEGRLVRAKPAASEPKTVAAAPASGAPAVLKEAGPSASAAELAKYDASGRLVAVQSQRPGAAPYAILDDKNHVKAYISPGPQVNLQAYVGRLVGINGVANNTAAGGHVVAQRVDVLGGPVRR